MLSVSGNIFAKEVSEGSNQIFKIMASSFKLLCFIRANRVNSLAFGVVSGNESVLALRDLSPLASKLGLSVNFVESSLLSVTREY